MDFVEADIAVANILDAYFRKGHTRYVVQDAFDYLEQTQDRFFDVTSAFAVFQWLMIQTTVERGISAWSGSSLRRSGFVFWKWAIQLNRNTKRG